MGDAQRKSAEPDSVLSSSVFEVQFGSKGLRFFRTPLHRITSFRMHAPIAGIFGFPPATSLAKKPARTGWNRTAICVGRNNALRSLALLVEESRQFTIPLLS